MDRVTLDKETAISMISDGERVHTFRSAPFGLVGADWDRADIIEAINKYEVELSGEVATRMDHGIVLEDERGYLFIETKPQR